MKKEIGDMINPVLVKELRQYLHGRLLISLMALMLAALILTLLLFTGVLLDEKESGVMMFTVVSLVTALSSIFVVPFGALTRFVAERSDNELDFSRITTLTPGAIVRGKLAGAVVMLLFIFSLSLPFMVIAYFLRGISMTQMLITSLLLFVQILGLTQLALLAGATGKRWITGVFVLAFLQCGVPFLSMIFMVNSFGSGFGSTEGMMLYGSLLIVALGIAMTFMLTISLVSSPNSNRTGHFRIFAAASLIVFPLLATVPVFFDVADSGSFALAVAIACILITLSTLESVATLERGEAGARVVRHCPRRLAGRGIHFLFSSGWTGGITLSLLLTAAVVGVTLGAEALLDIDPTDDFHEAFNIARPVMMLILFYAEFALILKRMIPAVPGWVWLILVTIVLSGFPFILDIDAIKGLSVFYPLSERINDRDTAGISIIAAFLALAGFVCLLPPILSAFAKHRPPEPESAETLG